MLCSRDNVVRTAQAFGARPIHNSVLTA